MTETVDNIYDELLKKAEEVMEEWQERQDELYAVMHTTTEELARISMHIRKLAQLIQHIKEEQGDDY